MSKAIETLMGEHRFIEQVLGSLQTFIDQLEHPRRGARERVAQYAEFFREFADRCHHGKEEDRLFEALGDHGFPRQGGPIFVMVGEHNIGRLRVKELAAVGAGDGMLSADEVRRVRASAGELISMLRAHIQKEDQILFPAAERTLPPPVLENLAAEFDRFEHEVMGEGAHERLHALGKSLIKAHQPSRSANG